WLAQVLESKQFFLIWGDYCGDPAKLGPLSKPLRQPGAELVDLDAALGDDGFDGSEQRLAGMQAGQELEGRIGQAGVLKSVVLSVHDQVLRIAIRVGDGGAIGLFQAQPELGHWVVDAQQSKRRS